MKKFSVIMYALKLLIYIPLSFVVSFGFFWLIGQIFRFDDGNQLVMSFIAFLAFLSGFWNFFFYLRTPPAEHILKLPVWLLSISIHPLFILLVGYLVRGGVSADLSKEFQQFLPSLSGIMLANVRTIQLRERASLSSDKTAHSNQENKYKEHL